MSFAKAIVKEKPLKHYNIELRRDKESASSQKAAKLKVEWRQVRVTESSESCCSNADSASEEEQVKQKQPAILPIDDDVSASKALPQNKGKARKMKWVPKPADDLSATEPSSAEGSDDDSKEYIYTQVCRHINQLTLDLDKLRKALLACEVFLEKYQQHKKQVQSEFMSTTTLVVKNNQVPVIQVECKVKKHWKLVTNVVIDGGAGVNIMFEYTRRNLGITNMKEAPFKVQMADHRVVQPLGLVENIQVKFGGAKLSVSFLVLDLGDAYSMLLGRPWLKIAEVVHDWTTNTITLKSKGEKVVLSTDSKKVEETKKPELLCQKQTPKQIEKMLAATNIIPAADIDLNIVMKDLEKAQEQRKLFPGNFQEQVAGTRSVNKTGPNAVTIDYEPGKRAPRKEECMKGKHMRERASGSDGGK